MAEGELQITTASSAAEVREFIMLPFRLYEGVEQWVPPLISELSLIHI